MKILKKFSIFAVAFVFLLQTAAFASATRIWIDGNYVTSDVDPIIENGRTLVPVRVISENLMANVEWDEPTQEVRISKDGLNLVFTIGNKIYNNNGIDTGLDTAPKIVNGRTMVPIRAIAEGFSKKVDWDGKNMVVIIGEGYVRENTSNVHTFVKTTENKVVSEEGKKEEVKRENRGPIVPKGWRDAKDKAYKYSDGKIIANTRSMIYHVPSGRDYKKVSIKNAVFFETESDAVAAGYRRAQN